MKQSSLAMSALVLTSLLAGCTTMQPQAVQKPHRTIIFVWDGMRPDAISQADTPNLYALQRAGVNFTDNHSTYPTMTMMNAASFATGSFPGTTGFYGNTPWNPGVSGKDSGGKAVDFQQPTFTEDYAILKDMDSFYSGQLFLVDTLFQTAQKAGLKTVTVGKSGPAFLQDYKSGGMILDERHVEPASLANALKAAGYKLPKLTPNNYPGGDVTLSADNGDPTAGKAKVTLADKVTSDPTSAAAEQNAEANSYMMNSYINYILPTQKPDLSLVWLRSPDSTEHSYGVGTAPFRDALHTQDKLLGQLQAKLKEMGELESTNIIIVSDHAHSNVAGDSAVFPLRALSSAGVGKVDMAGGYSVSGDVRTADLMTRAGLKAYDGSGCIYDPVMSGIKADGTTVYPDKVDTDGSVCGAAGTHYTTPSYKVPASLSADAFVVAANGGSDYLYLPSHDAALVQKAVSFFQSRPQYGAVFVDDRYHIPGTLPLSRVRLENAAGRNPDIMVSFAWDKDATVQGFKGTIYESASNNRGQHGSFSPVDVHNTLVASGPNFKRGVTNTLPSGNVDVAPTVAHILGLSMPQADGRVLQEALSGGAKGAAVQSVTVNPAQSAGGLKVLSPTDLESNNVAAASNYNINLQTKVLTQDGKSYTYFDSAQAIRK